MRIKTPEGAYRVIRVLKKEWSLCYYLAEGFGQQKNVDKGQLFLCLEIRNPVLAKDMMLMFMEMKAKEQSQCPDFVECFVKEGTVWAVFRYHEGVPFAEAAKRAVSRKEQAALWEGVLEQLFFQRMPLYLRYEAAAPVNLVVDETSAVRVNYELSETDRMHDDLWIELQKRLYESFCILFPEIESDEDGLMCYAGRLAEGSFADEAALYREFRMLREQFHGQEERRKDGDGGVLLRLWRLVYGHTDVIAKCCYLILVAALWGIFFFLCFRPKTAPEERNRIFVIGTVEVEEAEQDGENREIGEGQK